MATEASTPVKAGPTTAKIAYQHENQKDTIVMVGTIGGARYPTTLNKVDVEIKDLREVPDFKPTLDKNGFSVISGQKPLPRELKDGDQKVVDEVYAQITETLKREYVCFEETTSRVELCANLAPSTQNWLHRRPHFLTHRSRRSFPENP
jgi:hypothetical protein